MLEMGSNNRMILDAIAGSRLKKSEIKRFEKTWMSETYELFVRIGMQFSL
jgi:hypothetical protein